MSIKDYPFTRVGSGIAYPALWVRVVNPTTCRSLTMQAVIDTSADVCAFPAVVAKELGYDLSAAIPKQIRTAAGRSCAYEHPLNLEVLEVDSTGQALDEIAYVVREMPVDFVENLNSFLLGRTFLRKFILEIDFNREVFSIRQPKK